jgi:hypothetical protein
MTDDDNNEPPEAPDHRAETAEPDAQAPPRRWLSIRQASHQHPVSLPIGAGFAGLILGAGITAALLTAYAPVDQPPTAYTALPAGPPARVDQAPTPRTWPRAPSPHGLRPLDDPPPPPPGWGPGTPPPFGGPPPPPAWGPPPPGWGPPPPPFGGPPPPPPGWGPGAPPPGPWGPPGPGGPPPPPGPPA